MLFSPAGKVPSRRQARAAAASKLTACMLARRSSACQTKRAPHLDAAEVVVNALAAAERQVGRKVERDRAAEPAQRLADSQALVDGLAERALQVRGQRAAVHRPARRGARQRRLANLALASSAALSAQRPLATVPVVGNSMCGWQACATPSSRSLNQHASRAPNLCDPTLCCLPEISRMRA